MMNIRPQSRVFQVRAHSRERGRHNEVSVHSITREVTEANPPGIKHSCYNPLMDDWKKYVEDLGRNARRAAGQLATLQGVTKVRVLKQIADAIRAGKDALLSANALDVSAAQQSDLGSALVERLKLNDKARGRDGRWRRADCRRRSIQSAR